MPPFDYIDWGPEVEHRSGYTFLAQPAGVPPVHTQPQISISNVTNDQETMRRAMAAIIANNDQAKKIRQPTAQKAWTQATIEKNHAKHVSFVQARLDQMIRKNETDQLLIHLCDATTFDRSAAEAWANLINTPAYHNRLKVMIDPSLYEFFRGLVRTKNPVAGKVPLHIKAFDEPIRNPRSTSSDTAKNELHIDPNVAWINAQFPEEISSSPIAIIPPAIKEENVPIKPQIPDNNNEKSWFSKGLDMAAKGLKAVGARLHNDAQTARGIGSVYRAGLDIARYFQEEKTRKGKAGSVVRKSF